jgi:UDP-glucose:(glucosyl)LPS alpha-1,2-glucosyltransferase
MEEPLVAVVLPPREGFGPARSGAIGLLTRLYAGTPGFRTLVIGGPQDGPVHAVPFEAVKPVPWLPINTNLRYVAGMIKPLRRAAPALIEVHNRPEIAMALAKWLPQVPVALVMHNDPVTAAGARSPAARIALLKRLAMVMTASDYLRRRFMEGISEPGLPPVELLPNCIDLGSIPPPAPREKVILFVGRVVANKGPDSFIQACEQALPALNGWRAEIIGADGMSETSRETEFLRGARAMAVAAGIRMLGYRDHPLVLDAMSRAGMVVVPSRWDEPFGLTGLEAMACGAPLLCSMRGGLPEVVGDAAVPIDPDDIDAMANQITALAEDEERRAALSALGRARAKGFDVSIGTARLAALRGKILNSR